MRGEDRAAESEAAGERAGPAGSDVGEASLQKRDSENKGQQAGGRA